MVDSCRSKLVNVASGVPQGSVLGLQLFLLYTAELFSLVQNKLYGYADNSTLVAVVRMRVRLNASKTKTMIVSRSCTVHLQLTPLTLDGTVLGESANLVILG